jgi:hypothetical protein
MVFAARHKAIALRFGSVHHYCPLWLFWAELTECLLRAVWHSVSQGAMVFGSAVTMVDGLVLQERFG